MNQPDIDAGCTALSIAREEVGNERDRNKDAHVAKILAEVSATIADAEKRLDRLRIARAQHADAMVGVRAVNAIFNAFEEASKKVAS